MPCGMPPVKSVPVGSPRDALIDVQNALGILDATPVTTVRWSREYHLLKMHLERAKAKLEKS